MEMIWKYTFFNELRQDPEGMSVMQTEPPQNPSENRKKMLEYHFETFNVDKF